MAERPRAGLFVALTLLSFVPIWRQSAGGVGLTWWEYMDAVIITRGGDEYYPHVTIEEGIENARMAYCDVMGLDYEQSYSSHYVSRVPAPV